MRGREKMREGGRERDQLRERAGGERGAGRETLPSRHSLPVVAV